MEFDSLLADLAKPLALGGFLDRVRDRFGPFELHAHWKQGEFHHDVVLRLQSDALPVLVASTNCNGGIKELLALAAIPARFALWNARCPDNPEFDGELPTVLGRVRSVHWFDPCELLGADARSELLPRYRRRQRGGGWEPNYE